MKQPPPVDVAARINRLRSYLGCRKGLETGYIPAGLREAIKTDMLFVLSLAIDPIDPDAYDHKDTRLASDLLLVEVPDHVKNISLCVG